MAGLEEAELRRAWEYATQNQVSVRQLEDFLKDGKGTDKNATPPKPGKKAAQPKERDPNLIGLEEALRSRGVGLERAKVGDRYVLERMKQGGSQVEDYRRLAGGHPRNR